MIMKIIEKFIIMLIIITFILPVPSYADQSIVINKDEKAPFSGILMDKEKAEKIKDELIEKDGLVQINSSYEKSVLIYKNNEDLLNQKSDILLNQNLEMSKALNSASETSSLTKIGYFLLGVVVTGLAVHEASRLK